MEGIHHVGQAVEAEWEFESVLYAPDTLTSRFAHDLISRLDLRPQPVTPQVMKSLSDKENPQGILAVVKQRQTDLATFSGHGNALALVSPQDPGNVGTILRTMDAVGLNTLFLLDGGVELFHPSVVRASMGALFWKTIVQTTFGEFHGWARNNDHHLIGTSAHGDLEYHKHIPESPWVLVLGNEQKGLSAEQLDACDVSVSLPMRGRVSSLNLSVAAGVLLYQYSEKNRSSALPNP